MTYPRFYTQLFTALLFVFLFGRGSAHAAVQNPVLSGEMPAFGDVELFVLSPDGRYAVYRADSRTDNAIELFSAPTDGSTPPVPLTNLLPADTAVGFLLGVTDTHVVYMAEQDTLGQDELYSVPITGGTITKLNGTLPVGGQVTLFCFVSFSKPMSFTAPTKTRLTQ